ncbi:hypothetical protein ACJIZ3_005648 [Penstemon smallii]|uniref:N-acetyltransferase n=1 Tax=Penstemon smallii TaxID=265156 RepID=A0ABD3S5I3_9LAMI
MARKRISSLPSSSPISIGNCEVVVEAKNFTSESNQNSVQISISKTAKIKISVVEETKERGDYYFVLANPKDSDDLTKSLLQEVLNLYMKELPAMNYAANTGKESMFLEKCLKNGKYCTLLLKSKEDKQPEKVIAAITYQIIPADTQHAEIPLAAVSSVFQYKGIGRFLYLELRKRLQSVGIRTLFCWGDKESEGFWLKQGFTVIGEVDKKGKARRLRIKADIRRALCFPGGSTLMVSHLMNDSSYKALEIAMLPLPIELLPGAIELSNEVNLITSKEHFESNNLVTEKVSSIGCQDVSLLPDTKHCSVVNASVVMEDGSETNAHDCSCSMLGTKKRTWEASCTSLKSKKVKGTHSSGSQIGSQCPVWTSDGRIISSCDRNCLLNSGNKHLSDASPKNSVNNSSYETNEDCRTGKITNEDFNRPDDSSTAIRIMLMNIADENKKSNLTKIIEDLGGVVTSDGSVSTHVVTGKVRMTSNFCTALCSGSWVISPGWLKESFKKGRFVDEMQCILKDEDYEAKYRTELKYAVLRAKKSPNALLNGLDIWLATHVQPPARTLSAIVKSAGGNVICSRSEINDTSKTIFVACEEDMEEARSAVELGIWTFSVDWLMNCIMRQELDLEAPQFAESL